MGCPDWPKCFDRWIPPTQAEELPPNYRDIYARKRAVKNKQFAKYLNNLGFTKQAKHILQDESILKEADFNPYKTWTEYVNRLLGVLTGLVFLGLFVVSLSHWSQNRSLVVLCASILLLTIFQGWIGSIVVSTNLISWMVTVHMLVAMVIVLLLVYTLVKIDKNQIESYQLRYVKHTYAIAIAVLLCSVVQIVLGTQVRENIDHIAQVFNFLQRDLWIENLAYTFYFHRSFSSFILVLNLYWLYEIYRRNKKVKPIVRMIQLLTLFIILEILAGVVMAYFAIPPPAQPIHLLLAMLVFSLQGYLFFILYYSKKHSLVPKT